MEARKGAEDNGYWDVERKTKGPTICPYCGQRTEREGYYDRGTQYCPACNARSFRQVRGRPHTIFYFRRYAEHVPPWDGLDLAGAQRVPEDEVARMRLMDAGAACPLCGGPMEPVVWRIGDWVHRPYMFCEPCGHALRTWCK